MKLKISRTLNFSIQTKLNNMKKTVFVFGLIAGLIVAGMMLYSTDQCITTGNFEKGMIYGYTGMLVAFSMIFVGIKNFRDRYNHGILSFGKAFKVGLFIALVASTIYVITWLFELHFFYPDFADKYAHILVEKAKASGGNAEAVSKAVASGEQVKEWYKNPVMVIVMTYVEILPVGLVVSLIAAAILKRKKVNDTAIA